MAHVRPCLSERVTFVDVKFEDLPAGDFIFISKKTSFMSAMVDPMGRLGGVHVVDVGRDLSLGVCEHCPRRSFVQTNS